MAISDTLRGSRSHNIGCDMAPVLLRFKLLMSCHFVSVYGASHGRPGAWAVKWRFVRRFL